MEQVKLLEAAAENNHLPPTPFLVVVGDQDVANSLPLQAPLLDQLGPSDS